MDPPSPRHRFRVLAQPPRYGIPHAPAFDPNLMHSTRVTGRPGPRVSGDALLCVLGVCSDATNRAAAYGMAGTELRHESGRNAQ